MIQATPCQVHLDNTEKDKYPSLLFSVNQYKDQFGTYPVAVVKSKSGNLMSCRLSSIEVEYPNGTPCRIISGGTDYTTTFIGTFDFSDGENAYPVAVVRGQNGRLVAVKVGAVHFLKSTYLFERKSEAGVSVADPNIYG